MCFFSVIKNLLFCLLFLLDHPQLALFLLVDMKVVGALHLVVTVFVHVRQKRFPNAAVDY